MPSRPGALGSRGPHGFSLIELMVVVSLMSVIILGLTAMFSQTQRAFRLGMNQTDVLESGRMGTDLIAREIEQMAPTYHSWFSNAPNFYAQPSYSTNQNLPPDSVRTNTMDDLFFVTRENQTWRGIGYFVRAELNVNVNQSFGPLGTLYRTELSTSTRGMGQDASWLYGEFQKAQNSQPTQARVSKILDGVVHFRVRTFDPMGYTNRFIVPNIRINATATGLRSTFFSNAVPAFVELEVGMLESDILERYQGLPAPVRANYLRNQAAHVHLFRQRIPIRNVDLSAYP